MIIMTNDRATVSSSASLPPHYGCCNLNFRQIFDEGGGEKEDFYLLQYARV